MTVARRILLVDGDETLRSSLAEQLRLDGQFETREAATVAEAMAEIDAGPVDAILLDLDLPDVDGRDACRLLRGAGVTVPLILLSPAGREHELIGLDGGPDDCIARPFRVATLLARLRAHLHRQDRFEDACFTIGPYSFKPGAKLLVDPGKQVKVRLTEKETAILKYLYRAGQKVIGRETLLHEVWGYNPRVTTHTVETHVYRLRRKIERDPSNAEILVTETGGYRLIP